MKWHRKSHSRKARKHQKKSRKARKTQRKQRQQRGGDGCAAMPYNRSTFQQSGGMAAIGAADGLLLDRATLVQAQTAPTVDAITESGALATAAIQRGGRRHRRSHKGRKSHRRQSRRQHQRGGMAPIDMSTRIPLAGINNGWETEAAVRSSNAPFYYNAGPQPATR